MSLICKTATRKAPKFPASLPVLEIVARIPSIATQEIVTGLQLENPSSIRHPPSRRMTANEIGRQRPARARTVAKSTLSGRPGRAELGQTEKPDRRGQKGITLDFADAAVVGGADEPGLQRPPVTLCTIARKSIER